MIQVFQNGAYGSTVSNPIGGDPDGRVPLQSADMTDDISTLRRILGTARTIAVVGLSAEWHRPSHFAAQYMQAKGYRMIPVNPRYESILGERCYKRLEDIPLPVD